MKFRAIGLMSIIALCKDLVLFCFALLLVGVGAGLSFTNNPAWILSLASAHFRGKAVGALSFAIFLGQFASPFLSTPLVAYLGLLAVFLGFAALLFTLGLCFLAL